MYVEQAIALILANAGRRSVHGEGRLWVTIVALLLAERISFRSHPDQLPIRHLAGPLDLGSPHFTQRRKPDIESLLEAIRRGEASQILRSSYTRYQGYELAGVDWRLGSADLLCEIVEALSGDTLAVLVEHLLFNGWRSARGLPDLVVLPGDPVRLSTFPSPSWSSAPFRRGQRPDRSHQ